MELGTVNWKLESGNWEQDTDGDGTTINVISYSITSSIKIKLNDMRRWDIKAMRCVALRCDVMPSHATSSDLTPLPRLRRPLALPLPLGKAYNFKLSSLKAFPL